MSRAALLTFLYAGTGMLLTFTAIPMWLRRVPPNAWYGFRTARTLSNAQVWYAINQTAGRDLIIGGMAIGLGAMIFFLIKDRLPYSLGVVDLILLVVSVGAATIHSFYALSQISQP